jgi:hypothetical protein
MRVFSSVAEGGGDGRSCLAKTQHRAPIVGRDAKVPVLEELSRTRAVRSASTGSTATSTTVQDASTRCATARRSAYGISKIARYTRLKSGAKTTQLRATPTRTSPIPATQMNCTVCSAPALPIDDACVFCPRALVERDEPHELLDYLVEAHTDRAGQARAPEPGPITELWIDVDGAASAPGSRTSRWRWRPPGRAGCVGRPAADQAERRGCR